MPLFKKRKCVCNFDTVGAGIEPNPVGEFFCPQCGRELFPVEPKEKISPPPGAKVSTEPGTEE